MKHQFMRFGFLILLISAACSGALAQNNSEKTVNNYDCEQQPLGVFRQITDSSIQLSGEYYDALLLNKQLDIQENRWTLDSLDEVDPAYKFDLSRNPSNYKKKCNATMDVVGKLVSPTGKLFDFKQATYDIPSRKLKFTTVERDGITYEVEAQFYAEPRSVNGTYEIGTVKLKATGKALGTVSKEFRVASWSFE